MENQRENEDRKREKREGRRERREERRGEGEKERERERVGPVDNTGINKINFLKSCIQLAQDLHVFDGEETLS